MKVRYVFGGIKSISPVKLTLLLCAAFLSACLEKAEVKSGASSYQPPGPTFSGNLSATFTIFDLNTAVVSVSGECTPFDSNLEISQDDGATWFAISGIDVDCSDTTFAFDLNDHFGIFGATDWTTFFPDPNSSATRTFRLRAHNLFGPTRSASIYVNYQAPIAVGFALASSNVSEAASSATVAVTLSSSPISTVTVDYMISGGSASGEGVDYSLDGGTLTFATGVTSRNISIALHGDLIYEDNETIELTLINPQGGASLGPIDIHLLTIQENEDYPVIQFAATSSSASEGVSPHNIVVEMSPASAFQVVVSYDINGSSTADGDDYTYGFPAALTLAPGVTSATISFAVSDDAFVEGAETMILDMLPGPANATLGARSSHTHTITDNDTAPEFSFAVNMDSTDENAGPATITVNLSSGYPGETRVDYRITAGGTATGGGTDYTLADGTLTFAAMDVSEEILVPFNDDNIYEGNETFIVEIHSPMGGAVLGALTQHTHTITDNEVQPTLQFAVPSSNSAEGVTHDVFVTMSGAASSPVTVNYIIEGTSTATQGALPNDYTLAPGTLTFASEETAKIISIVTHDDGVGEGDEFVNLRIQDPTGPAALGAQQTHAYQIDANQTPTIRFVSTSANFAEDNVAHPVIVELSNAADVVTTVDYVVNASSTAEGSGQDYTLNNPGTLTFNANVTSLTITVNVLEDIVYEPGETIILDLQNPTGGHSATIEAANDTYTIIVNDDDPFPQVGFQVASGSESENVVDGDHRFNVVLSNPSFETVTVEVTLAIGGNAELVDITGFANPQTITFNPGDVSGEVLVPIFNDAIYEGNETQHFVLMNPTGASIDAANAEYVLTINDDESPPTLAFTLATDSTNEDAGSGAITVELSHEAEEDVTVSFSAADVEATNGGVDYNLPAGTLTFSPGVLSQPISFTLNDDGDIEGNETFRVDLGTTSLNASLGGIQQHVHTIVDDEGPPQIGFLQANSNSPENIGSHAIQVQLSAPTPNEVTVEYIVTGGSATGGIGNDYVLANGTLTFAPMATVETINILVNDDTDPELDETVELELQNPSAFGQLGAQSSHVYTIDRNDYPNFTWTGDAGDSLWSSPGNWFGMAVPTSGATAYFNPDLCIGSACDVTIDSAPLCDDIEILIGYSGTISQGPVDVDINDLIVRGGTFNSNISRTVTLARDFIQSGGTININSGQISIGRHYTRTGGTIAFDPATTVEFLGSDNSSIATMGESFPFFAVNKSNASVSLTGPIPVNGSAWLGGSGTSQLLGSTLSVGGDVTMNGLAGGTTKIILNGSANQQIGTITSGDFPSLEIASSGGTVEFVGNIRVAGDLTYISGAVDTISATVRMVGGIPAALNTGPMEFSHLVLEKTAPGTISVTGSVLVNNDLILNSAVAVNGGEFVVHGNLSKTGTGGGSSATRVIGSGGQTISSPSGQWLMGTFTVDKPGGALDLATMLDLAGAGQDLVLENGTINMNSFDLNIADTLSTAAGTIINKGCGQLTYAIHSPADGTINGGTNNPLISINDVSIAEGNSGTIDFNFVVSIDEQYCGGMMSVQYNTSDAGATAGADYLASASSVIIPGGSTSATLSVSVLGDTTVEPDEMFHVNLFSQSVGTIVDNLGVGTIINDDADPLVWESGLAGGDVKKASYDDFGRLVVGGTFKVYDYTLNSNIVRIDPSGVEDSSFITGRGFNAPATAVEVQPDGRVIVAGYFTEYDGVPVFGLIRLFPNGAPDSSFIVNIGTASIGNILAIAVQSDGKIIIGGTFDDFNGVPAPKIIRLNGDGTRDASFDTNVGTGFDGSVRTFAQLSDGKILAGGNFTNFNGAGAGRVIRLNADGSHDPSFSLPGTGLNASVYDIEVLADGDLYVSGGFTTFNGVTRNRIIRLNSDGTEDTSFNSGTGFNGGIVQSVSADSLGRVVAGGSFTTYQGATSRYIVLLDSNGSRLSAFDVTGAISTGAVAGVKLFDDGKVLITGVFSEFQGDPASAIVRALPNGNYDTGYDTGTGFEGISTSIQSIYVYPDGRVLAVGSFDSYRAVPRKRMARFDALGALDSFNSGLGFDNAVNNFEILDDGRVVAVGSFTNFNGNTVNRIVQLLTDGNVDPSFNGGTGFNGPVNAIIYNAWNGSMVVGGNFSSYNGTGGLGRIVRLSSDGTLEADNAGAGFSGPVTSFAEYENGKIYVGGNFTTFNGITRHNVVRLNNDLSLDMDFNPNFEFADGAVNSLEAERGDGKLVVGGEFSGRIRVLDSTGSPASGFTYGAGFNGSVKMVVVPPDGTIIVGGDFSDYKGSPINNLARLDLNGELDMTLPVSTGPNGAVYSADGAPSGHIIFGGAFTNFDGMSAHKIHIYQMPPSLTLGQLRLRNVGVDSFEVEVGMSGDTNENASAVLWYCNSTINPGCDPTMGNGIGMTRDDWQFTAEANGIGGPSDNFNVRVVAIDPDGVNGMNFVNGTVELLPSIGFEHASYDVLEGGTAEIVVKIENSSYGRPIVFEWYTSDGTAQTSDSDYTSASGTATILVGETSATLPLISVGMGGGNESAEYFNVNLNVNYSEVWPASLATTVNIIDGTDGIGISNIQTSSTSSTSFDVSVDFSGDADGNAQAFVYFCNLTDNPACDPFIGPYPMNRSAGQFYLTVSGLSVPDDPMDTLRVAVTVNDPGGVYGTPSFPLEDNVTLAPAVNGITLGAITFNNITSTSFDVAVTFTGDDNNNAPVSIFYCNETLSSGCNPEFGSSSALSRNGTEYSGSVAGFGPFPGQTLNVRVVHYDLDGGSGPIDDILVLPGGGAPLAIYRSVGPSSTFVLASGVGNNLTITNDMALFSASLPSNVGLGDALQYDSDDDGFIDAVAFIHERIDSSTYRVRSAAGTTPTPLSIPEQNWNICRAYTGLAQAENGTENTSCLDNNIENFDTWSGGRDLVANNEQWNIVLYDDDIDLTNVLIDGWTTGPANYLKIFTPVYYNEVGMPQRHTGAWFSSGYLLQRNLSMPAIDISDDHVVIEGLRIELLGGAGQSGIRVSNISDSAKIEIGNNIINASSGGYGVSSSDPSGELASIAIFNNIIFGAGNMGLSLNARNYYVYHNTIYGSANFGVYRSGTAKVRLKNNLIFNSANSDIYASSYIASDYNATSDGTTSGGPNDLPFQTMLFADEMNGDFHLAGIPLNGANLNFDPDLPILKDIDGEMRSNYTIGADEYAGPPPLYVEPVYPGYSDWNQYVSAGGFSACGMPAQRYHEGCKHGGEARKVLVMDELNCTNLSMEDDLGVFRWRCDDQEHGYAVFYTDGFKPNKGLRDLIYSSGSSGGFHTNRVTLFDGGSPIRNSNPMVWDWGNSVEELPDNSAGGPLQLASQGTVYYSSMNRSSGGYHIDADEIAIVTLGASRIEYNGNGSDFCDSTSGNPTSVPGNPHCLIMSGGRAFLWLEVSLFGDHVVLQDMHTGILGVGLKYSRIHNTMVSGTNVSTFHNAVSLKNNSNSNFISGLNIFRVGSGFELATSSYNTVHGLRIADARANATGISFLRMPGLSNGNVIVDAELSTYRGTNTNFVGVYVNGSDNVFSNMKISNIASGSNAAKGVELTTSANGNKFSQITVSNVAGKGFYIQGASQNNTIRHVTVANNTWEGFWFNGGGNHNLVHSLVAINNDVGIRSAVTSGLATLRFVDTAFESTGIGVDVPASSGDTVFEGFIITNDSCMVTGSTNIDSACSNGNLNGSSIGGSVGTVATDDLVNSVDNNGSISFATLTNVSSEIGHFLNFQAPFRLWGREGVFPGPMSQGDCTNGNCRIIDLGILSGEVLHDRSGDGFGNNGVFSPGFPCPLEAHGSLILTNAGTGQTFVKNAIEVMGDGRGDEDTLCESNEACIYAPNIGAYQGEGSINFHVGHTCSFAPGAISNVDLYVHPVTGVGP